MGRIVLTLGVLLGLFLMPARLGQAGTALEIGKMKAALHTATPEEDGFLKRVSKLVENDVLPRSLVETTFVWARKKPDNKFQYFKRGLIVRAKKQGIQL